MSDLVGNPEDLFSHVAAHMDMGIIRQLTDKFAFFPRNTKVVGTHQKHVRVISY